MINHQFPKLLQTFRSSLYFNLTSAFCPKTQRAQLPFVNQRYFTDINHKMSQPEEKDDQSPVSKATSLHQLEAVDIKKHPFKFDQLKGKVVLVVNVASKCGFTPQYKGLEALYQKYKGQGLEIVGFPSNQFGSQEPGSAEEIQTFCSTKYQVTFPIMEKIDVNGNATHPVYQYLKNSKSGILGLTRIKWNFEKFLVDKDGKVVERYWSATTPESLEKPIEKLLASN